MGEYLILKGPSEGKKIYLTWCNNKDHMADELGILYHVNDICPIESIAEYEKIISSEFRLLKDKHDVLCRWMAGL